MGYFCLTRSSGRNEVPKIRICFESATTKKEDNDRLNPNIMHFGRIENIEGVDFALPPDDPMTENLWQGLVPAGDEPIRIYVGCTEWGRKNWVGKVYPKGTKEKDFLANYVKQ